ncbi:MAG TPA: hypothetical protein VFK04_21275 [Gemmatimonadaceae bacterium]|nr:hypothetical protein [Gemmatimonadaceae bacterium]
MRFLAELFLVELFLVELFLEALFFDALFLAVLFLVVAPFFRAVAVRFRELPPRARPLVLFFAAVLRFLVRVERFLGEEPLSDAERVLLARLRLVLRLLVPLRLVDFRPADFALDFPRADFLVVAIHALRVSRWNRRNLTVHGKFRASGTELQGSATTGFRVQELRSDRNPSARAVTEP